MEQTSLPYHSRNPQVICLQCHAFLNSLFFFWSVLCVCVYVCSAFCPIESAHMQFFLGHQHVFVATCHKTSSGTMHHSQEILRWLRFLEEYAIPFSRLEDYRPYPSIECSNIITSRIWRRDRVAPDNHLLVRSVATPNEPCLECGIHVLAYCALKCPNHTLRHPSTSLG